MTENFEKFYLCIDATSDGESIKAQTEVNLACSGTTAIHVILNLIEQNDMFKEVLEIALRLANVKQNKKNKENEIRNKENKEKEIRKNRFYKYNVKV